MAKVKDMAVNGFDPKKSRFKSGPQISIGSFNGSATTDGNKVKRSKPISNCEAKEFKEMLNDPTIALAVDIITALSLKQPWTIECADELYADFVWTQIEPWRKYLIQSTMMGFLLNGFKIFEVLYGIEEFEGLGQRQTIAGIKALRPDITQIIVEKTTGDLLGCVNRTSDGDEIEIDKEHMLFINLDKEGFGEYGKAMLKVAQRSSRKYEVCEKGAQKYDEKVAGGFLWLTFPVGTSPYNKNQGDETPNEIICDHLAQSMRGVGYACAPRAEDDQGKPVEGWTAQFLNDGGMQHSFVDRLKYLDGQKMRAFGVPERSATEGSLGTKAEAEAHADIAIMVNGERIERMIDSINTQVLEPFNRSNTGDPGLARVALGKLDPDARDLFSTIFTQLMMDPIAGDQVSQRVDVGALLDKLGIPQLQESSFSEGPDDQ